VRWGGGNGEAARAWTGRRQKASLSRSAIVQRKISRGIRRRHTMWGERRAQRVRDVTFLLASDLAGAATGRNWGRASGWRTWATRSDTPMPRSQTPEHGRDAARRPCHASAKLQTRAGCPCHRKSMGRDARATCRRQAYGRQAFLHIPGKPPRLRIISICRIIFLPPPPFIIFIIFCICWNCFSS
jgi:hypothetical protein